MIDVIPIGDLRHRVTIQTYNEGSPRDAFGGTTETYSDYCDVWAKIEDISAREYDVAKAIANDVSHKITIRYREGMSDTMRFVFGNHIMEINGIVNPEMRNIYLYCYCIEAQN